MLPAPSDARAKPSVPITSSWCKRALRPLTSIIVRLERHWKDVPLDPKLRGNIGLSTASSDHRLTSKSRARRSTTGNNDADGSGSESSLEDPTWAPGRMAGCGRVKHRYSGRGRAGATRSRVRVVARSPEAERLRPGEFTVSTPLILGRRGGGGEEGYGTRDKERNEKPGQVVIRKKNAPLSWEGQNRLQQQHAGYGDRYDDPAYRAIVQGVYISWLTFLTTTACRPQKLRGARSLVSMALDKTSEYILHEQARLDNLEDKDADTDVADYIITELENTYAFHDRGWEPLKELVRAHGIRLMCEAVRKRHFSPRLSRSLILNAAASSFYDAAEALLSALLSLSPSIPPPGRLDNSLAETDGYVSALTSYVERTGRRGIWYEEMATLIARGAVPVEWLATDGMKTFMTIAIQSVSSGDACSTHSARFMTTVLQAALGMSVVCSEKLPPQDVSRQTLRKQTRLAQSRSEASSTASEISQGQSVGCDEFISTALTNTMSSILTILCGAHLTRLDDATADIDTADISTSPMREIISLVSITVQQMIELKHPHGTTGHFSTLQSLRIGYILMADYILTCQSAETFSCPLGLPTLVNFERFLNLISNRGELVGDLSVLVLQVSRCWGRARGTDGFEQVKSLTDTLNSTDAIRPYPILHAILTKTAVEVALNFAELTCLRDHHTWALHVQERVADLGLSSQSSGMEGDWHDGPAVPWTPSLALPSTGFRWEDGIGEWVANSPVLERGKRKSAMVLGAVEVVVPRGGSSASSRRAEGVWSGDDGDDDLRESEWGFDGSNTAPSSMIDEDVEEEDGEKQSNDDGGDSKREAELESPPPPPRAKKRSLLADAVDGASKRRKQCDLDGASTPRRRLRRRRTCRSYTVYRDDDDNEDEEEENDDSNEISSSPRPLSGSGPVTRRRALKERNSAVNLSHHDRLQRRKQGNVDVVIKIPPVKKSPRMEPRSVQVVIPHNGWCSGWKGNNRGGSVESHGSEQGQDGRDDEGDGEDDETKDPDDDEEQDEEDIFTNAPILRDKIHPSRRWSSFSHSSSPASTSFPSSRAASRHSSRSSSRQLRPRASQLSLLRSRSSLTFAKKEGIPCSQESSDDELSFV